MSEAIGSTREMSTGEHLKGIVENLLPLDRFHRRREIVGNAETLLDTLKTVNPPDADLFGQKLESVRALTIRLDSNTGRGIVGKIKQTVVKFDINRVAGEIEEEANFLKAIFGECRTPQEGRDAVANLINAYGAGVDSRINEVKRWARKELINRNLAIAVGNVLDTERNSLVGQVAGTDNQKLRQGTNVSALRVQERYDRAWKEVWTLTAEMIWGRS